MAIDPLGVPPNSGTVTQAFAAWRAAERECIRLSRGALTAEGASRRELEAMRQHSHALFEKAMATVDYVRAAAACVARALPYHRAMSTPEYPELRETHRGHEIVVTASQMKPGRWRYDYLIDGRVSAIGRIHHETAEAALRQGLNAARTRVDGIGTG